MQRSKQVRNQWLSWYTMEGMVILTDIHNGVKGPSIHGYQNCNTSQVLIFGDEYEGERIFVYLRYYSGRNNSKPYCTRTIFLAWYIDPNGIKNNNNVKYPYRIGIKNCNILVLDIRRNIQTKDTRPTLVANICTL